MPLREPVTLEEAKIQCRIENDTEDTLFSHYITAAREFCEDFLNKPLAFEEGENPELDGDSFQEISIPAKWKQAILLIVAFWYSNREDAATMNFNDVPLSAMRILWQDRDMPI